MREDEEMQQGSGYSVSLMARICEFIDILEAKFGTIAGICSIS